MPAAQHGCPAQGVRHAPALPGEMHEDELQEDCNRRILLIDDAAAIHEDFRKILSAAARPELDEVEAALFGAAASAPPIRFELDSAFQGQDGLAKVYASLANNRPYALAFVDMRMPPGWDGVETIEHLWQVDPRLQIVICTAYADYSWNEMLARLDVGDRLLILKKPFDAIEVCQLASALTAKWQLTRQAAQKMAGLEEAVAAHTAELRLANENLQADMLERLAAEDALRKSEAKFAAIFSLTPDPMALSRIRDGVLLEVNRAFAEYFGYAAGELSGRATLPHDLHFWTMAGHRQVFMDQIALHGEVRGFETMMRRKDGTIANVLLSGQAVDIDGARCAIIDCHDITKQKQHEEHLDEIAHHDALTKLPNRLLLDDRLHQAIAHSQRSGTRTAVCYLDLDGFKEVNDRLGHQVGDQLLIEVARRLTASLRADDTVARLGGDEFVLLLSELEDDEECCTALVRILEAVSAPYQVGGKLQASISASIGVTVYPSDPADPDTLLRHADHAMYAAKQSGKNCYHMFDTRLERRIEARNATLQQVEVALAQGQLRLHYQPKVDCRQGRIVGAEALIRWQHPTLGMLSPAEFLPLVEEDRLAIPVGTWVIREALRQMDEWQQQGLELCISVNAFARQLLDPGFTDGLAALLREFPRVAPQSLKVEIVESAALNELETVQQVIEACGSLGVGFSLDDFGTGYCSFVYLRHLPAQEIKIDQSFVRDMLTNTEDETIVEAVIGLGHAFRRSVVAEGAETPAHIAHLLSLGCNVMQGYALARPMPAMEFARWAGAFRPDPAWLEEDGAAQP